MSFKLKLNIFKNVFFRQLDFLFGGFLRNSMTVNVSPTANFWLFLTWTKNEIVWFVDTEQIFLPEIPSLRLNI